MQLLFPLASHSLSWDSLRFSFNQIELLLRLDSVVSVALFSPILRLGREWWIEVVEVVGVVGVVEMVRMARGHGHGINRWV